VKEHNRYAFIFDMDGVLTDNMKLHALSWVELFNDFGLNGLEPERYLVETAGMKGHDVLKHFLDPSISATEAHRLTELKDFLYRVMSRKSIHPLSGLTRFLDAAESLGIRLGVGTGSGPKNTDYVLGLLGIQHKFQAVVTADQVVNGKPAPDIFLEASRRLSAHPSRCIVFEDAIPGVEAAERAGMKCVALSTTNSPELFSGFSNVIAVINDFNGLTPEMLLDLPFQAHLSTQ
jgi:beta-phosphoglucomutase